MSAADEGILEIDGSSDMPPATVGSPFAVKLPSSSENRFNFIVAPTGLTVGNRTGVIRWTPTPDQTGPHEVKINDGSKDIDLQINVEDANIDEDLEEAGWLSPNGGRKGKGTYSAKTKSFDYSNNFSAFHKKEPRKEFESTKNTIYLRGGIYIYKSNENGKKDSYGKNINIESPLPKDAESIPDLKLSGADGTTVVIKPWGNERVMFRGGVDGTLFRLLHSCKNLRIENIELRGESNQKTYDDAINAWWDIDKKELNGNGFAIAGKNICIKNCVLHEIMSQALACKLSTNVIIEDCIIANSARWTIAGTTGIGFVSMEKSDNPDNEESNQIKGCLVYGVESRLFSHVFSKKKVHMTIDEGEGLLAQPVNQATKSDIDPYTGITLFENSALMHCGKGIVINGQPNCHIKNCTIYETGTTITGESKLMRNNKSNNNRWERCVSSSVKGGVGEYGKIFSFGSPKEWDNNTSYNKERGGFLFDVPFDEVYRTSDGRKLEKGKKAQLKYDANRDKEDTPYSFTPEECKLTSLQGYWVDPVIIDCYGTTNDNEKKAPDGVTVLDEVFSHSRSTTSIATHPSVPRGVGANPDHIASLLDRARSFSVDLEISDYYKRLSAVDEDTGLNGYQQQTKHILDILPEGLTLDYSNWHDEVPYIDDKGKKQRDFSVPVKDGSKTVDDVLKVKKLELIIVHPYKRD